MSTALEEGSDATIEADVAAPVTGSNEPSSMAGFDAGWCRPVNEAAGHCDVGGAAVYTA